MTTDHIRKQPYQTNSQDTTLFMHIRSQSKKTGCVQGLVIKGSNHNAVNTWDTQIVMHARCLLANVVVDVLVSKVPNVYGQQRTQHAYNITLFCRLFEARLSTSRRTHKSRHLSLSA